MGKESYIKLTDNIGYLLLEMPQDVINEVKVTVDEIQNDFTKAKPYNHGLAGQIDKEYLTKLTPKATSYIQYAVDGYCNKNPKYVGKLNKLLSPHEGGPEFYYVGDAWVNFQEKYEYNPLHNHSGVFSFVIWYQIPFYKENEIKYGAGKGGKEENNVNGDFSFTYSEGGEVLNATLGIDKRMEGYMAVFPSDLSHSVNPFYTSDDYRITISGNVFLTGHLRTT